MTSVGLSALTEQIDRYAAELRRTRTERLGGDAPHASRPARGGAADMARATAAVDRAARGALPVPDTRGTLILDRGCRRRRDVPASDAARRRGRRFQPRPR